MRPALTPKLSCKITSVATGTLKSEPNHPPILETWSRSTSLTFWNPTKSSSGNSRRRDEMEMTRELFDEIVGADESTDTRPTPEIGAKIEALREEGRKVLSAIQERNLRSFPWLSEIGRASCRDRV